MFKKKPHVKPLSPLRSSDRRRIADQIIAEFRVDVPSVETAQGEADEQGTTGHGALRNALLPENALSARFTTTAGPELKQVSGTVYVGTHPGNVQRVLWLKLEERMFPTVYTLWHNPRLVPLLHTPSIVLQKLRGGADLMIPGLAGGPPFPREAKKDSIVAIASLEKPSVPMVVGVCEVDVSGLQKVLGEKGRAVRGVHWEGDELWAWTSSDTNGGSAPERIVGWEGSTQPQVHTEEEETCKVVDDAQDDGGVSLNETDGADRGTLNEASAKSQHVDDAQHNESHADKSQELSTKEIDDAFRNAFLYAIYQHKATHRGEQHCGLQFPLSQSFVISNLVLPFLPSFTPAQVASLQIKKTSWKSAKKFIKHLEKELIVKSKDRNGGETVILDVDFEDRAILEFVPYKLPKKETSEADGHQARQISSGATTGDGSLDQQLKLITMFRPKEKVAPIFESSGSSVKSLYLGSELGPIITTYLESEGLVSATNKRLINLNPVLANAVFDGQASIDREVLSKGNVPRDVLMDRIIQSCSPFWVILRDKETRDDVKPRAGTPPKVQVTLETRSGNKTMTKISGVEAFHINPQVLADELQKTCASSTSVSQLVGSSPKNPVKEILVQGPQKDAVSKALERRGVRGQWINVLDKTKGKKK